MRSHIFLIVVFVFMSCSETKQATSSSVMHTDFDMEGHRGCRGLMPENTWPAMKKALDLGVTRLEMDIVFTKDKDGVSSHDQWFSEEITTKPDGTYMDKGRKKV